MLIALQASQEPSLPWWVLYGVLLLIVWATWRMARVRWWAGCLTAMVGWMFIFTAAVLTLPAERWAVTLLVTFAPLAGWLLAMGRSRRPGTSPTGAGPMLIPSFPPEVLQGQPSARSVLRSKLMAVRYAAGMPQGPQFVARMTYRGGVEGMKERPVDLFVAGDSLWLAPLQDDAPPVPIALRDVLRVDAWPETDAPPTLRVSWSPPAGEYTREVVLGALPAVPQPLVATQVQALATALDSAVKQGARAAELAADAAAAAPRPRICSGCGSALPQGARACPACGAPA